MKKVVGKFIWFNEDKGYGIIESKDGQNFFAHASDLKIIPDKRSLTLSIPQNGKVEFEPDFEDIRHKIPRARKISLVAQS